MRKCKYCNKVLVNNYIENKIGHFCSEEHYNKFLKALSNEEYIQLQNKFCICSDD